MKDRQKPQKPQESQKPERDEKPSKKSYDNSAHVKDYSWGDKKRDTKY